MKPGAFVAFLQFWRVKFCRILVPVIDYIDGRLMMSRDVKFVFSWNSEIVHKIWIWIRIRFCRTDISCALDRLHLLCTQRSAEQTANVITDYNTQVRKCEHMHGNNQTSWHGWPRRPRPTPPCPPLWRHQSVCWAYVRDVCLPSSHYPVTCSHTDSHSAESWPTSQCLCNMIPHSTRVIFFRIASRRHWRTTVHANQSVSYTHLTLPTKRIV